MFGVLPVCRLPPKMGQMPRKACTVNAFVIYLCVCGSFDRRQRERARGEGKLEFMAGSLSSTHGPHFNYRVLCWLPGAMSSHTYHIPYTIYPHIHIVHSTGWDCEAPRAIASCLVLLFTQITASGSCLAALFVILAVSVLRSLSSFLPAI